MKICIAAAVNEPDTLATCLARSPDIVAGHLPLNTYMGYSSAGAAYNKALADCADADIVIFTHQDVYLPNGTAALLRAQLETLTKQVPSWAIAGAIGGNSARTLIGQTWCSGHEKLLGSRVSTPTPVITLDEMVLIVRVAAGQRFDEKLPGFHLYGADIILAARAAGLSSWVIDLPVVHHSRAVISLSGSYREAYRYMQRKWRHSLPIYNLVCPLERGSWRYWLTEVRLRWKHRRRTARPEPIGDPVAIAHHIGYETAYGL